MWLWEREPPGQGPILECNANREGQFAIEARRLFLRGPVVPGVGTRALARVTDIVWSGATASSTKSFGVCAQCACSWLALCVISRSSCSLSTLLSTPGSFIVVHPATSVWVLLVSVSSDPTWAPTLVSPSILLTGFTSLDPQSTLKLKEDIMPALTSSSNLYELRYVYNGSVFHPQCFSLVTKALVRQHWGYNPLG